MKKKRSKGVTFWGWVFIVFSVLGLLGSIKNRPETQIYGFGLQLFSIASCLATLVCGIFILRLNETARKAAIILAVISVISIPIYFKPIMKEINSDDAYIKQKKIILEQMKPEYQEEALKNLERGAEVVKKAVPIMMLIFFIIPLSIFELIPIYFFTRPKVKEQFKESMENT